MPTFSVITVCYNEASHIRETLDSIVGQTCADYELIVVDGGSTDGTRAIIEQYAAHIAWWCSEPDEGIYNAMNKGVRHATGEYVLFMNGGDSFHATTVLDDLVRQGLDADVIEGHAERKDNHALLRQPDDDLLHKLLTDGLSHQSALIRRALLLQYPYDERYKIVADWKFWLQTLIADHRSYRFTDVIVADIDMTGTTYALFQQNLQERDAVLKELLSDNSIGYLATVLRDYNYLTHNTLVQYAVWLDGHSPRGYQFVRKIAKRVVRYCQRHS